MDLSGDLSADLSGEALRAKTEALAKAEASSAKPDVWQDPRETSCYRLDAGLLMDVPR